MAQQPPLYFRFLILLFTAFAAPVQVLAQKIATARGVSVDDIFGPITFTHVGGFPTSWTLPTSCLTADPYKAQTTSFTVDGPPTIRSVVATTYLYGCYSGGPTDCCPPGWRENGSYAPAGGLRTLQLTGLYTVYTTQSRIELNVDATKTGLIACPNLQTPTELRDISPGFSTPIYDESFAAGDLHGHGTILCMNTNVQVATGPTATTEIYTYAFAHPIVFFTESVDGGSTAPATSTGDPFATGSSKGLSGGAIGGIVAGVVKKQEPEIPVPSVPLLPLAQKLVPKDVASLWHGRHALSDPQHDKGLQSQPRGEERSGGKLGESQENAAMVPTIVISNQEHEGVSRPEDTEHQGPQQGQENLVQVPLKDRRRLGAGTD
ncbi:hypothetical protein ABW19_dt0205673 [Dactylella cylindrospora]|nr:hypothetical protein ABW19_dt0205673 [Dactylella cylindrospora]